MSDTSPDFPSRRDVRTGNTGAIILPDQPPQTRRERKLREHLAETGALVTDSLPTPTPVIAEPAPSVSPPSVSVPTAPTPPASPPSIPPLTGAPPLTRRQLREQLRTPATDAIAPAPSVASTAPIVEDSSEPVVGTTTEDYRPPPQGDAPIAPRATPLPPVFAPPAVATEDSMLAQSRSVGPAAPATNALILPVAPPMDMTGPLGDTGEVLITGNIPLPKHVVETGITGVIDVDSDDDDDFIDADSGVYTQPIRAIQAVSSRSLELEAPMIKKPRWGAVSLALGISAAVLGVTAVSLLALALLTDIVQLPL